ncbi:hypothetical protein [Flavobacterium davisii]|uniref:hypothetical protein n=1 Tax=Flavobacterium davisii TaxID=2906077 RepID=UPI0035D08F99
MKKDTPQQTSSEFIKNFTEKVQIIIDEAKTNPKSNEKGENSFWEKYQEKIKK